MRRGPVVALFLAIPLLAANPLLGEPKTWEFEGGRWPEVKAPTTAAAAEANEPTLDQARLLLSKGEFTQAKTLLVPWLHQNHGSPAYDRALYLMAETLYQYGDRKRSFYYLEELLDEYPASPLFPQAIQKQFQIGDDFLGGYKLRLLYFPILAAEDEGIEILHRVQERAPGSEIAERALLRSANYYYVNAQYEQAGDAYHYFLNHYPRSKSIPGVRLRAAFASYAQFRGLAFDATAIIDARAQLVQIERDYPQLAADENVAAVIDQIDRDFALKLIQTADFYQRTHNPKGAAYLYRYLLAQYPNSPEAPVAQSRLNKIPAWALAEPPPASENVFAPTTKPSTDIEPN